MMIQTPLLASLLAAPLLLQGGPAVEGWTSWRGPLQTGVSLETGLPDRVEPGGENHLWSFELHGRGTPAIASGRVYALGYRGEGPELREGLVCLDEATGSLLWERWWNDFLSDVIYDRYSIGAPTVDPATGNVFVLSTPGVLMAMTRDGELLWERDLSSEYGRLTFPNGRTGAPAIDGDLVIANVITGHWGRVEGPARTRIYAFDKHSGLNVWTATPGGPPKDSSFCFPVFEWRDGRRLLYGVGGGGYVFCVDARTGQTLWRYQVSTAGMNSFPVIDGDRLIVINGKENVGSSIIGGMLALPLGAAPPSPEAPPIELSPEDELWRNDLVAFTSSPVLVGRRAYQTDMTGELACVDTTTGQVLWRRKLAPDQIHASPVAAEGKLYVPMTDGLFWILRPSDQEPEVLCRAQLEGECLGAPAICNGRIYVHTTERLYCFGTGEGRFVAPPPAEVPSRRLDMTRLQVRPADLLLRQGESVAFQVRGLDALGNDLGAPEGELRWVVPASVGLVVDSERGLLVAPEGAKPGVGVVQVQRGEQSGSLRVRIVPELPYREGFEGIALSQPDPEREGVLLGDPPPFWIGALRKWDVRELEGGKVLAKTLDNPLFQRATAYFGHPEMSSYAMRVDILSDGNRRSMSTAGLIHQRYLIQLKGNHQELEVSSNDERLKVAVPFRWQPGRWYTLASRVELREDGSALIRAKAWERGEAEPTEWALEVPHRHGHEKGSPGIFSFSPQSRFRVYLDNLSVTPDE